MNSAIRFGGPGFLASPSSSAASGPTDVAGLLQEFLHYTGKIWLQNRELPQDAESLSRFGIDQAIAAYREYRAAGGEVPLDDGLDLEESCLLVQLVTRRPFRCLLNSAMPDTPTGRIERVASLAPTELVETVRRRWHVELSPRIPLAGQLERWGDLAPAFTALVYDGDIGHCIILRGVERGTGRFVYWDPWPLRSLLCAENNAAGVEAQLVDDDIFLWALESASLERVLFAVFVPA